MIYLDDHAAHALLNLAHVKYDESPTVQFALELAELYERLANQENGRDLRRQIQYMTRREHWLDVAIQECVA